MRYTGPLGKAFSGDKQRAMELQSRARVVVGRLLYALKRQGGTGQQYGTERQPDGSVIHAMVMRMIAGQEPIIRTWIESPQYTGDYGSEEQASVYYMLVYATQVTDTITVWRVPLKKAPPQASPQFVVINNSTCYGVGFDLGGMIGSSVYTPKVGRSHRKCVVNAGENEEVIVVSWFGEKIFISGEVAETADGGANVVAAVITAVKNKPDPKREILAELESPGIISTRGYRPWPYFYGCNDANVSSLYWPYKIDISDSGEKVLYFQYPTYPYFSYPLITDDWTVDEVFLNGKLFVSNITEDPSSWTQIETYSDYLGDGDTELSWDGNAYVYKYSLTICYDGFFLGEDPKIKSFLLVREYNKWHGDSAGYGSEDVNPYEINTPENAIAHGGLKTDVDMYPGPLTRTRILTAWHYTYTKNNVWLEFAPGEKTYLKYYDIKQDHNSTSYRYEIPGLVLCNDGTELYNTYYSFFNADQGYSGTPFTLKEINTGLALQYHGETHLYAILGSYTVRDNVGNPLMTNDGSVSYSNKDPTLKFYKGENKIAEIENPPFYPPVCEDVNVTSGGFSDIIPRFINIATPVPVISTFDNIPRDDIRNILRWVMQNSFIYPMLPTFGNWYNQNYSYINITQGENSDEFVGYYSVTTTNTSGAVVANYSSAFSTDFVFDLPNIGYTHVGLSSKLSYSLVAFDK